MPEGPAGESGRGEDAKNWLLLAATFVLAICGLVYELIAGTVSSYLLGDSVYHFSLVIGLFMSAMGLGAWLSRFVERPEPAFVGAQIALALAGGFSAPILFSAFALVENYNAFLFLLCIVIGALVGLEIPLVIRILEGRRALKVTLSNVLTADYVGALAAALLFPLIVLPQLGLMGASLLFGALNLAVAGLALWLFWERGRTKLLLFLLGAALALGIGAFRAEAMQDALERKLYAQEIVFAKDTRYQRIVLTREGKRHQFFLNGSIQFDTLDEYRYHETLVHPAMTRAPRIGEVLILGGGDGMAVREALRYPEVERVTLVDIDPEVTGLFQNNETLVGLNDGALLDPRVEIVNDDAWKFLERTERVFDVAILDLPDPKDVGIAKLYTVAFYADLTARLAAGGVIASQATSPVYANRAFSTIVSTLDAAPAPASLDQTLMVRPLHSYVPSFGDWGFVLAGGRLSEKSLRDYPQGLQFLTPESESTLWVFPKDAAPIPMPPNTLLNQTLPRHYEMGWSEWFE